VQPVQRSYTGIAFSVSIAAGLLASCAAPTDLSAISKYAATTAQSADTFAAVAADYGASCKRYISISEGIVETSSTSQVATFGTVKPNLRAFLIVDQPRPGYTLPPDVPPLPVTAAPASVLPSSESDPCMVANEVSSSWNQANGTVLDYVKALGNLAGVDAVPSPNPSPLVAGLSAAGVSSAATQAVSSLISSIAAYFENQAREHAINSFLSTVNPNMQGAVGALETVDAAYTVRLIAEYTATRDDYNAYVRIALSPGPSELPKCQLLHAATAINMCLASLSKAEQCQLRAPKSSAEACLAKLNETKYRRLLNTKGTVEAYLASVNEKLRASSDYGSAVEGVLKTHEQLYDSSQRNATFADYVKIIQTTGAPVVTDLLDLEKAVK
jgi:hypothetical protein